MDDNDISQHPDLRDPDWQRRAVREARGDLRRQRRRGRIGKRIAWAAGSLVVVAGAVFGLVQWGRSTSAHYDGSAPPPAEIRPTAPSVLPDIAQVDLTRPFAGTPAETWGESVDALTVPPTGPVGRISAAQVQNAVDQVKKAIHAARLDRHTIEARDGSAYLNLLAPNARPASAGNIADRSSDAVMSQVSFAAEGFKLLPANPRISGTITAAPGTDSGRLTLHASFVVGYAFDPDGYTPIMSPGYIDVFMRHEVDFEMIAGSNYPKADRGLWVTRTNSIVHSMACGPAKKGYLAPAYSELGSDGGPVQNEAALFDVTQPMPEVSNPCD
ncbi:hypothetical protein [Amycolatopsis thermophila]|uniref:Uncharacterized protein n=1 Tax=Amycolatopsis thermophila TaxID=206084 RepID=A0ABU0EMC3_9PSEU|nr:hypothetical protein [Amycolatopsis thermophila]MDQ0376421.1 hypothetical protein [Amycolatopsis thermophila]